MWFAALDGLVLGALVAAAAVRVWRHDRIGAAASLLVVGVVGGLTGALLGFSIVAGSTASGPLQPAAIVGGALGAVVTLVVFRQWVLGERAAAAAAAVTAARRDARDARARRTEARRAARGPSPLAGLAVVALVLTRRRR